MACTRKPLFYALSGLEKIWRPFFTTKAAGIALGLAIVRRIVWEHSGDIACTSAEGQGTCFHIMLPVPDTSASRARSCTSPLRIIVSPQKPGTMPPYHPIVRGLFAMIPHQFYYQLVVLGLLWLF